MRRDDGGGRKGTAQRVVRALRNYHFMLMQVKVLLLDLWTFAVFPIWL